MIDLNRTRVIVCSYPDYAIDHRMLAAFTRRGLPVHNILAAAKGGNVIERRNKIIKVLVLPVVSRYDWFVFIDHDHYVVRDDLFEPFFDDVDADVVGCEYNTGAEHSWVTPDLFHMGIVRMRGEIFENLNPPWFYFTYNEEHTNIKVCECGNLRNRILEAGYKVTRRGYVEHESSRTWC